MAAQTIPDHFRVAVRLARRDTSAMAEYSNTPQAAIFSFAAAFITLPMFFITLALGDPGVTDLPTLIADLGPYTVGWLLFPVVMAKIVQVIDREHFYCRYIVAVNWCAVFEYFVLTVLVAVRGQGIIPEAVGNLIFVGLIVWVLMYQHFVARVALEVDGTVAALLVGLRMFLDLCIVGLSKVLGG